MSNQLDPTRNEEKISHSGLLLSVEPLTGGQPQNPAAIEALDSSADTDESSSTDRTDSERSDAADADGTDDSGGEQTTDADAEDALDAEGINPLGLGRGDAGPSGTRGSDSDGTDS
jgi:hypothetical protein